MPLIVKYLKILMHDLEQVGAGTLGGLEVELEVGEF